MFVGVKYALSISTSVGLLVDFRVLAAHDAGQRDAFLFVGDQQHFVRQRAFHVVERLEFFAGGGAANDDRRTGILPVSILSSEV